jgi:hypothetical protein
MNELEILQPEESPEAAEVVEIEDTEEQVLEDITEEPGAHIEETQSIEQSEDIERELTEAVDAVQPPAEEETPAESGPERDDLPPGSGILEEPHETVEMEGEISDPGPADVAEVPEGMEFQLAGDDGTIDRDDHPMADPSELSEASDDDKDEATPINLPGPVAEEDDEDMQLISGPNRDDLPPGSGILEEPHETVEMAGGLEEPGLAEVAEVPEGMEFQLAGDDGTIDRDDHPMADPSELSEASDDDKDEATPINLPGPVAEEDDEDMQLISGPNRDDLPPGSGILEEPHETVEMEGEISDPGPADVAEVPEGMEFQLAGDDGTIDRDDHPMIEDPDLSPASDDPPDGEGFYIDETGTILYGEEDPESQPLESVDSGSAMENQVALDHTGPGGMVAESPDSGGDVSATPINIPKPGGDVSATPINIPKPGDEAEIGLSPGVDGNLAKDHPGTGGNVAKPHDPNDPPPPPDMHDQSELSPDDVKMGENLQPAPEFGAMSPSEESVVEIIGKAITDEGYRSELFEDTRTAITDYSVSPEDQIALGEMTAEAFDFFAAEVEQRFKAAMSNIQESAVADLQTQIMQQVVHAVWRDLNPGGLAYILAYKIPAKHL